MAVSFEHGAAHVAHQREHGGLWNAGFGHLRRRRVPEIMQAALNVAAFAQRVPRARDITNGPGGIQRPRVDALTLPAGEHVPFRLLLADLLDVPASMRLQ